MYADDLAFLCLLIQTFSCWLLLTFRAAKADIGFIRGRKLSASASLTRWGKKCNYINSAWAILSEKRYKSVAVLGIFQYWLTDFLPLITFRHIYIWMETRETLCVADFTCSVDIPLKPNSKKTHQVVELALMPQPQHICPADLLKESCLRR